MQLFQEELTQKAVWHNPPKQANIGTGPGHQNRSQSPSLSGEAGILTHDSSTLTTKRICLTRNSKTDCGRDFHEKYGLDGVQRRAQMLFITKALFTNKKKQTQEWKGYMSRVLKNIKRNSNRTFRVSAPYSDQSYLKVVLEIPKCRQKYVRQCFSQGYGDNFFGSSAFQDYCSVLQTFLRVFLAWSTFLCAAKMVFFYFKVCIRVLPRQGIHAGRRHITTILPTPFDTQFWFAWESQRTIQCESSRFQARNSLTFCILQRTMHFMETADPVTLSAVPQTGKLLDDLKELYHYVNCFYLSNFSIFTWPCCCGRCLKQKKTVWVEINHINLL